MSIALVQQVPSALPDGGSATKTITIATPGAGNTLCLLIQHFNSSGNVVSVTGGGVTWTKICNVFDTSVSTVEIWAAPNTTAASDVVAITFPSGYIGLSLATVLEFSGMPASLAGDPSGATNVGRSGTATSATVSPTSGGPVVLVSIAGNSGNLTNTPSNGFTALTLPSSPASHYVAWAYRIVPSVSGSYSTSFPDSPSYANWAVAIAGFDGATGGGAVNSQSAHIIGGGFGGGCCLIGA